ncbi:MAG: 16S rRNA (guanine(527)-N(7))-methyltransferase RsmG [Candidatus Nanopelagicales bacterium]
MNQPVAAEVLVERFGDSAVGLQSYAKFLADQGTVRGLIGPREVDRLWERHILNCAVLALPEHDLLPHNSTVIDVGSGAGLPGLVWAIVRPDLTVTLVESMKRRTEFLEEAVEILDLGERVSVVRARAEEVNGSLQADVTTARAVAALPKLLGWLSPLTSVNGQIIAMKGESAAKELTEAQPEITKLGLKSGRVIEVTDPLLDQPTYVTVLAK